MGRIHAIELHEQTWYPRWLRELVLQFLTLIWKPPALAILSRVTGWFGLGASPTPASLASEEIRLVLSACQRHNHSGCNANGNGNGNGNGVVGTDEKSSSAAVQHTVLDTCSGSGGPIVTIARENPTTRFVLSDLYPQPDTWKAIAAANPNVSYRQQSVDATNVQDSDVCLRTMCLSFHHMTKPLATAILADSVRKHQPIAIFETMKNTWGMVLKTVFLFPLLMIAGVFVLRPWSWRRAFFTFCCPLIPFTLIFDGVVSVLRTYSVAELMELIADAEREAKPDDRFDWSIREQWTDLLPVYIPYLSEWSAVPVFSLSGQPKAQAAAAAAAAATAAAASSPAAAAAAVVA